MSETNDYRAVQATRGALDEWAEFAGVSLPESVRGQSTHIVGYFLMSHEVFGGLRFDADNHDPVLPRDPVTRAREMATIAGAAVFGMKSRNVAVGVAFDNRGKIIEDDQLERLAGGLDDDLVRRGVATRVDGEIPVPLGDRTPESVAQAEAQRAMIATVVSEGMAS